MFRIWTMVTMWQKNEYGKELGISETYPMAMTSSLRMLWILRMFLCHIITWLGIGTVIKASKSKHFNLLPRGDSVRAQNLQIMPAKPQAQQPSMHQL
eukprot:11184173-Ditylum_brightwellii.AAC.1